MSHNKGTELGFFKFEGENLDTYTIIHNLNDLRPVVSIYTEPGGSYLLNLNTTILTVVDANTISIEFGDITDIRGTVIGFPEPVE